MGVFYSVCVKLEKEEKIESLVFNWISSNYQAQDFKKFVEEIENTGIKTGITKTQETPKTKQETRKEWSRLASFMSGRK